MKEALRKIDRCTTLTLKLLLITGYLFYLFETNGIVLMPTSICRCYNQIELCKWLVKEIDSLVIQWPIFDARK